MSNIQIFNNAEFGEIRTTIINGEPWFVGKDVAAALGYARTADAVSAHVDAEDKGVGKIPTPGGEQDVTIINESGLYSLVLSSKLPTARQFKRWVTHDVLPSIRKTGGYMTSVPNETPEQTMARAIIIAQATMKRQKAQIEEQQRAIEQKDTTISNQKRQIEEQKPAVTFTNAVSGSQSACLIGELAKLICQNGVQIGQNRLFEWMRINHYLGSAGERRNIPNQEYIEQGLFIVKKGVRTGNDGVLYTTKTTKVTERDKYILSMGF